MHFGLHMGFGTDGSPPPVDVDAVIAAIERGEEPNVPLVWESEQHVFTTMGGPAPDPKWHFTDAQGHEHHYGDEEERYPTLVWVGEQVWCPDCHEHHEEGHYECARCREEIKPGTVMKGPQTIYKPGPLTVTVGDQVLDPEQVARLEKALAR